MFLAECFTFSFVSVLWDFKIGPECIFFILQKNAFFSKSRRPKISNGESWKGVEGIIRYRT